MFGWLLSTTFKIMHISNLSLAILQSLYLDKIKKMKLSNIYLTKSE